MLPILSDNKFIELIENIPSCFFIEIGANDGISNDPIYEVVKNNNLPGILVEPNPDIIVSLESTYKNHKNIVIENCAITPNSERTKIYFSTASTQHNTLSLKYAETNFSNSIRPLVVDGLSFVDLLQKHNVAKVDLLVIDVEGYDFILLQTFPFNQIKPKIIRAEFLHTGFENISMESMIEYLESYGYKVFMSEGGTDIIAILQ